MVVYVAASRRVEMHSDRTAQGLRYESQDAVSAETSL